MSEHERLRILFEYSSAAIWEADFSTLRHLRKMVEDTPQISLRKHFKENSLLAPETLRAIKVLDANRAALQLFGVKNKQEPIQDLGMVVRQEDWDILVDGFVNLLEGKDYFEAEIKVKTVTGRGIDVCLRVCIPQEYQGDFARGIVTFQDISLQKLQEKNLRILTQLDGLTRLYNQVTIRERLDEELSRAKRYHLTLSCILIDLDNFKRINDSFGHQKGNEVLRQAAMRIKTHLREVDIVGRYGGDEFLCILPETPKENARIAAERIRSFFPAGNETPGQVTLSIGISGYPDDEVKSGQDFIAKIDKAMYMAKEAGRDTIRIL
ncbi:MAG TPA: hypothetical protein DD723_00155 [Candidatus Omnitrophica bacterium]|nr:MAG: hypothetical protein A2Z81_07175 [Omnitrophica WOR_2 bacterium GWA2_45_18]HBR13947.1 hypothetical protein [Candidatus Omnitrophota bacterium]